MRRRILAAFFPIAAGFVLASACTLQPLPCTFDHSCAVGGSGGDTTFHPSAPVDIRRDEHGMVHVYGQTDADTLYGAGYMQATDRLFQMELQKRHAQGRQAEVFGGDRIGDDQIVRILGIPALGHENAEAMKANFPLAYDLTAAWVAGVNARIADIAAGKAPMPTGFAEMGFAPEPWTVDDSYAIGKLIVFGNGSQLEFDALTTLVHQFVPDVYNEVTFYRPLTDAFILDTATQAEGPQPPAPPEGPPPALPPDAKERLAKFLRTMSRFHPGASNNFAIAGAHTVSGRSMIAGDPHQALRSPSLMWMSHLNSADAGGGIDVEGWCFVGTPGVSLGHNRDIAWTATTNYPDVTDLWDIAVDDAGNATIGTTTMAVESHDETIAVKGTEPVTLTVERIAGYGVLLPNDLFPLPLAPAGRRVLFDWTGFRPTNEARAFVEIQRAKNLDEFDAAIDHMELGSFNFVAATRDAITYRSSPLVPDRGSPATHQPAYELMHGDDPASFWNETFLPLDRMPHSRATESGVIVTANNDPFGFTKDGDLASAPYYFGAYYDPGLRAKRIQDTLATKMADHPLDEADMEAVQSDVHSLLADELLAMLATSYAKVPTDDTLMAYRNRPDLDALAAMFASWDHRMARDEAAPVAFEVFMYFLVRDVLEDDMNVFFEPIMDQEPIYLIKFAILALRDASPLVQGGNDLAIVKALDETAAHLTARYGSATTGFAWKDFHVTHFGSESLPLFDGGTVQTDGAEGTVNVSSGSFFDGENVAAHHVSDAGSIYRMVATFDEAGVPHAKFNMPRGNTGEPSSAHYDDLTVDWANAHYVDMYFDEADVEAHATEHVTLEP